MWAHVCVHKCAKKVCMCVRTYVGPNVFIMDVNVSTTVCIYRRVCERMHVCATSVHVRVWKCAYVYMHECEGVYSKNVYARVGLRICADMNICVFSVCMCFCTRVCTYACMNLFTHVSVHTHIHSYARLWMRTRAYLYTRMHDVCMWAHAYVCVRVYVYIFACIWVHIYAYERMFTYAHAFFCVCGYITNRKNIKLGHYSVCKHCK